MEYIDRPTSVIVWMQTNDDLFALRDVATEIFYLCQYKNGLLNGITIELSQYLISVVIRRGHFHGRRQVEDDAIISDVSSAPCFFYSFADFNRKVGLRLREGFRTILESESSASFLCTFIRELPHKSSMLDRKVYGLCFRVAKYHVAEKRRSSVVHMNNG